MQRSHHAHAGEIRWPIMLCYEKRRQHHGLPFFGVVFSLGQLGRARRR
jgi:hypothetical protein